MCSGFAVMKAHDLAQPRGAQQFRRGVKPVGKHIEKMRVRTDGDHAPAFLQNRRTTEISAMIVPVEKNPEVFTSSALSFRISTSKIASMISGCSSNVTDLGASIYRAA